MSITDPEEVKRLSELSKEICSEIESNPNFNVDKEIEDLEKALKASENNFSTVTSYEIHDLGDMASKYLSDKAKECSTKLIDKVFDIDPERGNSKVTFFTIKVKKENVENAVKELCDIANDLAEKDLIVSCLAPISSIDLARRPKEAPSVVVIFYPMVPVTNLEEIEKMRFNVKEGKLGETLGDLDPDLAPGEFLVEFQIFPYGIINDSVTINSMIFEAIESFLNCFPKGTKFIDFEECAVETLAIPYELKFYNPLMKSFKFVEFECVRHAELVNGNVIQSNLLVGITYVRRDGTKICNKNN